MKRIPKDVDSRPKAVLDINATELIAAAASLKTDDRLSSIPDLYIGATAAPHEPKADWVPRKLLAKAEAGAQFLLTYTSMDTEIVRRYMKRLVATQLTRKLNIIVSTVIFTSAEDAKWVRDSRPNVMIPESIILRLANASGTRRYDSRAVCVVWQELHLLFALKPAKKDTAFYRQDAREFHPRWANSPGDAKCKDN
jgi:5,10-methylenetetrahydrofolate reductase